MSVLYFSPCFKVLNVFFFSISLRHWVLNQILLRCKERSSMGMEEFIYSHLKTFLISAQSCYSVINAFYSNTDPFTAAEFLFHLFKTYPRNCKLLPSNNHAKIT